MKIKKTILRGIRSQNRRPWDHGYVRFAVALQLCITMFVVSQRTFSQTTADIENRLKAAYLLNFLQFIEWPPTAFESDESVFVLGILGRDPFGSIAEETFEGERIGDHPIVIKRFRTLANIETCDALYISASEKENLDNIFLRTGRFTVLTVSDIEGFEDLGGGIGFFIDGNKLRFAINVQTVKRTGLKVSSKLLRLAKVVDPI